jgi:hypothetical protein
MKLYKDFAADELRKKKAQRDREEIGLAEETVIIYEENKLITTVIKILKIVFAFVLLIAGIAAIGGFVLFLTIFKGRG